MSFKDIANTLQKQEPKTKMVTEHIEVFNNACQTCKHLSKVNVRICLAFPDGIPTDILLGKNNHTKPYMGDDGILYEKKE